MGRSILILLVCLCINYPELRTLLDRGAARRRARNRITGFIITCCRLLITENYERSAGIDCGWRWRMANRRGVVGGGRRTDAGKKGRHPSHRFVFSINFRKLRTIV